MKDKLPNSCLSPNSDQETRNRVLNRANEVFMDTVKAQAWMNTHNLALGDKPAYLLVSEAGENAVLTVLNNIEYGGVA